MSLASHLAPEKSPQSEPVPGRTMTPNSAGGFGFAVTDWTRLDRFLVLGSEGGTYYAAERKLTQESAACVLRCLDLDGSETVRKIVAVSEAGRAPKNEPAILALALACGYADETTKTLAYKALPKVCRTGTHLFRFAAASDAVRGWGRGLRRAIADWYLDRPVRDLAYQVTKYQNRDGWSHRDLLRLSHPKPPADDLDRANVLKFAAGKGEAEAQVLVEVGVDRDHALAPWYALEAAKRATSADEVAKLIRRYRLVREGVPTQFLNAPEVWEALIDDMPLGALVRNLATLTRVGLLTERSNATRQVLAVLGDFGRLKKARLHPLAILTALKTYEGGKGVRGNGTWEAVPEVVRALDRMFHASFKAVESTGKRWLLGLDVSGSMGMGQVGGMFGITPLIGTAAMGLVTASVEAECRIMGFSHELVDVGIRPDMDLAGAVRAMQKVPMGGTDCALPMLYAAKNKLPVDVFAVYTDSETWFGKVHPFQALKDYRQKTGIAAKLIVVGMVANGFTIADPSDAGMLDVIGFATAAPAVMADFARG